MAAQVAREVPCIALDLRPRAVEIILTLVGEGEIRRIIEVAA